MKTIIEILTMKISKAFEACGYSADFGLVKVSDRPDLCQFQCNGAFSAAKLYKKAPSMIANNVVNLLSNDCIFKKITAVGAGFINIDISDSFIFWV